MRTVIAILAFGALIAFSLFLFDSASARADHTGGGMQAMSIDMDEEATPANTSSLLGTRETCARINENNALDADEDVVDGLIIDVTAQGVPAYHDGGTPMTTDDTGGLDGYGYTLNYFSGSLTVQAVEQDDPAVNMLVRNPGSYAFVGSDPVPDNNANDKWLSAVLDTDTSMAEDGSGVLDRLTMVSESTAMTGSYNLTLSDNGHIDDAGLNPPSDTRNAYVVVNTSCDLDGDGLIEGDACPTFAGPASNNGCPPPGLPAVGGSAGLISSPQDNGESATQLFPEIAAVAATFSVAGGVLVRQLVARRARR